MTTRGDVHSRTGDVRPILIIDDDPAVAQMMSRAMLAEGFVTAVAWDAASGIERFRAERPVLVLLDLTLGSMSGIDVCRVLRAESSVPIIVVTAKDAESDKVAALEMGADDYVTKPFSTRELVSRTRAHLRRAGMRLDVAEPTVLQGGPVELDASRHEVFVRGELVDFTPKEFDLLETLLLGEGHLRTRDYLIDRVWGAKYFGDTKTLDVHVKRLRAKIELVPHEPEHLVTVRGLGYRFVARPTNGHAAPYLRIQPHEPHEVALSAAGGGAAATAGMGHLKGRRSHPVIGRSRAPGRTAQSP